MQQLDEFHLYYNQTRTQNQIQLTNQLARALTYRNLKRIQQQKSQTSPQKLSPSSFLYVCFSGLPPLQDEFQNLGLPGEMMYVYPMGFQPQSNQQQSKKKVQQAQLQQQILIIHNRLKQRTDKPLVFVYHSFGTTFVSTLFRFYYHFYSQNVIGLIALGPYTIRSLSKDFPLFIKYSQQITKKQLLQNVDQLYNNHIQLHTQLKLPIIKNKYANICQILAFGHGLGFREMFSYNRQWGPILKCLIYGRQDNRIDQTALNQTAIYYCYKRKFDQKYDMKLKDIYFKRYKQKIDNVQERFVFNIQKAKHSLHIQKKHNIILRKIIGEYLQFITQVKQQ